MCVRGCAGVREIACICVEENMCGGAAQQAVVLEKWNENVKLTATVM